MRNLVDAVEIVNSVNAAANELTDLLHPFFEKLVGKKILKAGEKILSSIKVPSFSELEKKYGVHICRSGSKYNIAFSIMASKDYERKQFCVYIGSLINGNTLESMYEKTYQKCDYTVEYVSQIQEQVDAAESSLARIKGLIHDFA